MLIVIDVQNDAFDESGSNIPSLQKIMDGIAKESIVR